MKPRLTDQSIIKQKRLKAFAWLPNGYIKAREVRGSSSASRLYDPVENRSVECLSDAERKVFFSIRLNPEIEKIADQVAMDQATIKEICKVHNLKAPNSILTTDFVIKKRDGTVSAISVKVSRDALLKDKLHNPKRYASVCQREKIGMLYWQSFGADYHIMFGDEVNFNYAHNVETVLSFYNSEPFVHDPVSFFIHLIATGEVSVDLSRAGIDYAKLMKEKETELNVDFAAMYEHWKGIANAEP